MARSKLFEWISDFENAYNQARFGSAPRGLTDDDIADWSHSLDNLKPTIKDKKQAIEAIRRANPYKWWELQRNFRWMKKTMKKLGLNPEDARYLL